MSGFESPNYTQVPNDLFEKHLPDMGYAELKVVMALLRETFGYHRTQKRMSIRKLAKATGLTPRNAYHGAMEAVKRGLLNVTQDGGVTIWDVIVEDTKNGTVSPANTPHAKSVSPANTPSKKEKRFKDNSGNKLPKERDPLLDNAAVIAYRDHAHLTPNHDQREEIARRVGDKTEQWAAIVKDWMLSGYRPQNVSGMLDAFEGGGLKKRFGNQYQQDEKVLEFTS